MHINPIIHTHLSFDRWMLPKVAWDGGWLSFHDFLHKHPPQTFILSFDASSAHNPWSFWFPFTPVSESFLKLDIHLSKRSTPPSHLTQQTRTEKGGIDRVAMASFFWSPRLIPSCPIIVLRFTKDRIGVHAITAKDLPPPQSLWPPRPPFPKSVDEIHSDPNDRPSVQSGIKTSPSICWISRRMDKDRLWSDRFFLPTCSRCTQGYCFHRSRHTRCLLQSLSQQTPTRTSSLGASTNPFQWSMLQRQSTGSHGVQTHAVQKNLTRFPLVSSRLVGCFTRSHRCVSLKTETYQVLRGRSGGDHEERISSGYVPEESILRQRMRGRLEVKYRLSWGRRPLWSFWKRGGGFFAPTEREAYIRGLSGRWTWSLLGNVVYIGRRPPKMSTLGKSNALTFFFSQMISYTLYAGSSGAHRC